MTDNDNNDDSKLYHLERVLDNLSILKEVDMIIVPLKPTDYMIKVGADIGGLDNATARNIYEAMVSISIFDPSKDELN